MEKAELVELESHCIQECAPWCSAACPVHVDARAMSAAIAKEDFSAAAKIFRRFVPFPGIISSVCDHPCQDVCKRKEVGEAVSIRALEKAALTFAPPSEARLLLPPRKNKRVAIVGAGLSGLTAAVDLAKKGYPVVIFEATDRLGGRVWDHAGPVLPSEVILSDFEVLKRLGIEIRFNTTVGKDISISDIQKEFDAVYAGSGFGSGGEIGLVPDSEGLVQVDSATFETASPGVFAGGGLVRGVEPWSPIRSVSDGRRAAITIDRFVAKVSLSASRDNEGSYETRLFTSTKGIEQLPEVPATDSVVGYSEQESVQEAKRCLQCECMECVKVCEYLASFKSFPRQYIRQMYNNLAIIYTQRPANTLILSCSNCGLCKEVCPDGLHMGEVCLGVRRTMVKRRIMPPSAHDFALQDMAYSNSEKCALNRHQPGMSSSRFVFFPGCQLSASSPENVKKTYSYLTERLDGGVGLMLRCCGAPAEWGGRRDLFTEVMSEFEAKWVEMGSPELIVACSTCYSMFKDHMPQVRIQSLWDVLDTFDLSPAPQAGKPPVVAVHDPCTSRHEDHVHTSVRSILGKLGYEIEELPLSGHLTECCGFGGLMYFANRELAERVIQRRIAESPRPYVAYCSMCRDYYGARGKPTWHLLDLIFGAGDLEKTSGRGPDYSQKHDNRPLLKNSLLKEVWSEEVATPKEHDAIKLNISDEVRQLMDKRMILTQDVQQVISWAEKTGIKLVGSRTGHFLAHYAPAHVTFWVEYSPAAEGFVIHNAYSHRMHILEDLKP